MTLVRNGLNPVVHDHGVIVTAPALPGFAALRPNLNVPKTRVLAIHGASLGMNGADVIFVVVDPAEGGRIVRDVKAGIARESHGPVAILQHYILDIEGMFGPRAIDPYEILPIRSLAQLNAGQMRVSDEHFFLQEMIELESSLFVVAVVIYVVRIVPPPVQTAERDVLQYDPVVPSRVDPLLYARRTVTPLGIPPAHPVGGDENL
mmetsp:Transcript_30207/g.89910  ORF Transcript_30207/g.89910 Transcript_30207/m.89910 type:complete len:205 (+) Transcript_30207:1727-2341(+)